MRKARNHRTGIGVAAALILFASGVPAQEQAKPAGLIPDGAVPALDVFFTGDVIGYVDPCG